jgi:NAD-specific glutamate dehydrogenase
MTPTLTPPFAGVTNPQVQQSVLAVQHALQVVPQQVHQIQQLVQTLPHQLQQLQQLVQFVPYQLQQLQQLIQLLTQHSSQFQQPQMLQPFQIPPVGTPGWQTGQPQLFGGQPGYVM